MMAGILGFLRRPAVVRLAQVAIGVVFLAAALAKIGDLATFAAQIHNFRLVPVWSENLVAMTLPWVELIAGLSLVLAIRPRDGGWVVTVLMAVFLIAVGQAVVRDLDIECGCFGTADASQVGLAKLLENTGLLIVSMVATLRPER